MQPPRPDAGERAFRVLLAVVLGAFVVMVLPFATALIGAAVVVVLAWPLHLALLRLVRGRDRLAAALSFAIINLGLVALLALLAGIVVPEAGRLLGDLTAQVQEGALEAMLSGPRISTLEGWLSRLTGVPTDLAETLAGSARAGLLAAAGELAQAVPQLVTLTGRAVLQGVIYLVALATFLLRGPALVSWVRRVSPLQPGHTSKIMEIFASFARNVVLAGTVTGLVQGAVAGVGYALAGVDRALLFATLTAVLAYVPLIGTSLVWVPLCLLLLAQGRPGAAAFVALWSVGLTSTVDNIIKPVLVRGQSQLPPLLVFLGVFGGLSWFGIIGLLVGPVLAATVMALLHIYQSEIRVAQDRQAP